MTVPKKWLWLLAAMQAMTLAAWLGIGTPSPARADGIPDAGAQNQAIIDQLKATNAKLDHLIAQLASGDIKVKVTRAEEPAATR